MIKNYLFRSKRTTTNPMLTGFGRLYNYHVITDTRGLVKPEYRVATKVDYENLNDYIEDNWNSLKASGTTYWNDANGTDLYGFGARGGGYRSATTGDFLGLKDILVLWCGDQQKIVFVPSDSGTYVIGDAELAFGASVRAIKVSPTEDDLLKGDGDSCDPYIGNDGQVYATVKINDQVWITKNLMETRFNTGAPIQQVSDSEQWLDVAFVPSLGDVYSGGLLFNASLDGRIGYILSEDDEQYYDTANQYYRYEAWWDEAVSFAQEAGGRLPTIAEWLQIVSVISEPEWDLWYYWTSEEIDELRAYYIDAAIPESAPNYKTAGLPCRFRVCKEVDIPDHSAQCIYDNDMGNILEIDGLVIYEDQIVVHNGNYVIKT